MTPAPITLRWRSQDVRIRRDDPRLGSVLGRHRPVASRP